MRCGAGYEEWGSVDGAMGRTYFDLLCVGELEHIVLWLSALPMPCRWFTLTCTGDLALALAPGLALREACHTLLSPASRELWEDMKSRLWFGDARVLLGAAEALRAVVLKPPALSSLIQSGALDAFCRAAGNLHALTIEDFPPTEVDARISHERLFRALGGRITELAVTRWVPRGAGAGALARLSCLRELRLKCVGDGAVAGSRFWRSVGRTLEVLHLKYARRTNSSYMDTYQASGELSELRHIGDHCRSLTTVCVSPPPACRQATFELLTSYGSQLEYARLGNPTEIQAEMVATSCPKSRVELSLSGSNTARILRIFGDRADEICLYALHDAEWREAEFYRALGACGKLRRFDAFPSVSIPFSLYARPELRILALYCKLTEPDKVLHRLTEHTGSLRKVALRGYPPRVLPFHGFIRANKKLQKLALALQLPPHHLREPELMSRNVNYANLGTERNNLDTYYQGIIQAVYLHETLCRVDLRANWVEENEHFVSEAVQDACVKLRHRKIALVVDKRTYLPVRSSRCSNGCGLKAPVENL